LKKSEQLPYAKTLFMLDTMLGDYIHEPEQWLMDIGMIITSDIPECYDFKTHRAAKDALKKGMEILGVRRQTSQDIKSFTKKFVGLFDRLDEKKNYYQVLGTHQDFEKLFGAFNFFKSQKIECPAYSEIYLQRHLGLSLRHPEYFLAKDLLYVLRSFCGYYSSAEKAEEVTREVEVQQLDIPEEDKKQLLDHMLQNNEIAQTYGRLLFVSAFNLLEGTLNGLIRDHEMRSKSKNQAQINLWKSLTLVDRTKRISALIKGHSDLDFDKSKAFNYLFRISRNIRNAMIHPDFDDSMAGEGSDPAKFYELSLDTILMTTASTVSVINALWKEIHGRPNPKWLEELDEQVKVLVAVQAVG
jgi:hypothetical protein